MIAYKFFAAGTSARFSGAQWPAPLGSAPGAWVEASGDLRACATGIHACHKEQLPYWLDAVLWQVELDGKLIESSTMIVAQRGRLLRPVSAWNSATQAELISMCVERARMVKERAEREGCDDLERARAWTRDIETFARNGQFATVAYVGAFLAHMTGELTPDEAYVAERKLQADWLSSKLSLR